MSLSGIEMQARGITTTIDGTRHESNLIVTSTLQNNNTHIECLAFHNTSFNFRVDEAVLYVQGQLSCSWHDVKIFSQVSQVFCRALLYRFTGRVS